MSSSSAPTKTETISSTGGVPRLSTPPSPDYTPATPHTDDESEPFETSMTRVTSPPSPTPPADLTSPPYPQRPLLA
ncbi:hypothetical protein Tco_1566978 [Tanacetum coccineum]